MKKYIYNLIVLLLFFIGFGYFFGDEYWEYHESQSEYSEFLLESEDDISSFSLSEVSDFRGDSQLHVFPDLDILDTLVKKIDAAEEKIFVEVYIFTERDMRDALIRAHKRWIEVKIILENNPYKAPYLNDNHYDDFIESGVDVVWSDPLDYSLNHAKMMIIDESAFISTGNFSYSLFTKNRDFMIELSDPDIFWELERLFLLDYNHEIWWVSHKNIVLSPYTSRWKLESLVKNAETSIDFYFPYIADENMKKLFQERAKQGIKMRGIIDENFWEDDKDIIESFRASGIEITLPESQKIHAKAILVDESILYIGSINFSTYSFDENREIGLIIRDKNIIDSFLSVFLEDFSK